MKKLVALLAILSISFVAKAQDRGSVLLKGYAGYTFADNVEIDDKGEVNIGAGFQWGGGLEYFLQKNSSIEVRYVTMSSTFDTYIRIPDNKYEGTGNVSYLLFDYAYYFEKGSKVTPYLGGGLGWGFVSAPNSSADGFAWDIKLGAKIKTGSAVTVNLEAYLQSMSEPAGTDYYYYYGYPYAVTDYASTLQFGLSAVLCYDFKAKN